MKALGNAILAAVLASAFGAAPAHALATAAMKKDAMAAVDAQAKQIQVMVDTVFGFAEPGFQEVRTSAYLADILEKNGFKVTRGVAGIPTAFAATWGSGGPLIALGSDIDDLLGNSQYPGLPYVKPMVEGAPGHGEGHNSGMPLQIAAAIAIKQVMEKNHLPGRLMLWPGVAEELLGAKAHYVRAGMFKGVDATIFVHVGSDLGTSYGDGGGTGLISVEYTFKGRSAHAAADPWDGLSALDGVEIMDSAWNFRREHLPITQRSHYVITNGGGQPNVVPEVASVWYYFRERTFDGIKNLYTIGNEISEAAAKATGTTVTRRTLGYAAPGWGNKPLAEAAYENLKLVGLPQWSADDQAFAKAVQTINKRPPRPLTTTLQPLSDPATRGPATGGASDDIGDVMWTVPTITIRYPSNIPNMIGHNVLSAIAMATPIAHKGVVTGAKAVALTVLDLMTTPKIIADAKAYQQTVQFKGQKYDPALGKDDKPAVWLNADVMARMRPQMEKFYYDSSKYPTYLDQLGIRYPTLTAPN